MYDTLCSPFAENNDLTMGAWTKSLKHNNQLAVRLEGGRVLRLGGPAAMRSQAASEQLRAIRRVTSG